jgi:hypothetical protein
LPSINGTGIRVPAQEIVMNSRYLIVAAALVGAAALAPAAQAKTMKECAAEWDKMKAANQTGGMKYRDFTKQCMSGASAAPLGAAPAPSVPATAAPAPAAGAGAPAAKPATGSPGRQAMIARERACGAEWKADKAAGKIPSGQKWPQYWSECDKRKKAQGM